jgi:hypothetical protein
VSRNKRLHFLRSNVTTCYTRNTVLTKGIETERIETKGIETKGILATHVTFMRLKIMLGFQAIVTSNKSHVIQ